MVSVAERGHASVVHVEAVLHGHSPAASRARSGIPAESTVLRPSKRAPVAAARIQGQSRETAALDSASEGPAKAIEVDRVDRGVGPVQRRDGGTDVMHASANHAGFRRRAE